MTRLRTPDRVLATRGQAAQSAPITSTKPATGWQWLAARTWPVAMLAAIVTYLSLPPVGWWPLVFLGPVPWLWLARRKTLPGTCPYRALWLSGFAFWMGTLHWLRLPHPATSI